MFQRFEDISSRISDILENRRTHLPSVQKEIEHWQQVDSDLKLLDVAVHELSGHTRTPPEVRQALSGFQIEDIRKEIAASLEKLRVLEARYARGTINIGVSGQARVGKSTMLQSISGLAEQQIPTGQGIPVTAVRSRIFHSTTHQRATLRLHSFSTFRDDVLRPYHNALGLLEVPINLEEFRRWPYPRDVEGLPPAHSKLPSTVTLLHRLREMQQALWSYEKDLTGGERTVALTELRQYVAYPTNEQAELERCPRCYLAVKETRIECAFPHAQVDHLGIIDLPGLGELASEVQGYHVAGLRNEVDIVLLMKRTGGTTAFWNEDDGKATNLLDDARGSIKSRRDFIFIVINDDGTSPTQSLRDHIRREANDGTDSKHFRVLECDAANQGSVYENVLMPVLSHLAERLPAMDNDVFEGARAQYTALTAHILSALNDLEMSLKQVSRTSGSSVEGLEKQAKELRKDLTSELAGLLDTLQAQARANDEDPAYLAALDAIYNDIESWIDSGFGKGKEAWGVNALREMRADKGSSTFAEFEFNRIRVEISRRYCSLDTYFSRRVDQLWNDISRVLSPSFGNLLEDQSGELALHRLAELLHDASEPCPALSEAVDGLLALHLEYRTHLHPLVRQQLDDLNLQVKDPISHRLEPQIMVPATEAGVAEMYHQLTHIAMQAAYHTKNALVAQAMIPALVLHAAAEQFEDMLIRSGDSLLEFKRLARSYRDEIWPGVYQGIDEANARFSKIMKAIHTVRENLNTIQ